MKTVYYTASATTRGGRNGHVETSDGLLELDLTMPEEMGGEGGSGTNPEQLFAAAYSACFGQALRLAAEQHDVDFGKDASITANVDIGRTEDGSSGITVELIGHLPDLPRDEAQTLMQWAHQVCPYSKATRGNIDVKLFVAD